MSDSFKPVSPDDVTDLALLPGEFRTFRQEMRDLLESVVRELQALGRIEERIDVIVDRQNESERRERTRDERIDDHERRIKALETKKRKPRK